MDTICVVPVFPRHNTKTHMREVRVEPGGQVATAMTTCSRLGLSARYIGSVGSDSWGKAQLESLQQENLELYVAEVEGAASQVAIIVIEEGVGERTILWRRDPALQFPVEGLRQEWITSGRILHVDGCDREASLQAARWAREAGIPVVIDIDEFYDDSTHELLKLVDYLIASSDFAQDPHELADRYGCGVVGITRGVEGSVFLDHGKLIESPAFKVPVADTTGAGDVFHGAFCYSVLQRMPLREALDFSNAMAALNCTALGARGGIAGPAEAEALMSRAPRRSRREFEIHGAGVTS
jgi:sulfofructose kinase